MPSRGVLINKTRFKYILLIIICISMLLFSDRMNIFLFIYNLLTDNLVVLSAWLSLVMPIMSYIFTSYQFVLGGNAIDVFEIVGARPQFINDSILIYLAVGGIVGFMIYLLSLKYILKMSIISILLILLIGLKGLYVFNVYFAIYLGLIEVVYGIYKKKMLI